MGPRGAGALGWTRVELGQHLQSAGASSETRARLLALLAECDRVRFAPVAPDADAAATASDRAAALIVALDRELA
jgi:hypothetical protein